MRTRLMSTLVAALVLSPLTAIAQQPQAAGVASTERPTRREAPHAPGAPAMEPAPGSAEAELAWFGDAIEDPLGPGADLEAAWQDGGADGPEQVRREYVRGPRERLMLHRGLAMRLAGLDLTAAQREKLRDLHEAQARKAIQRRADIQLARLDLHRLMRADKVDAAAVNAQIDKIARLHAEAMKAAFETRMLARAVLTPEQLEKLRNGPGARMDRRMLDGDQAPKR